jgi:hypothetical protein
MTHTFQAGRDLDSEWCWVNMGLLLAPCSYIVSTEAGTVADHTNRLAYANAVVANPLAWRLPGHRRCGGHAIRG